VRHPIAFWTGFTAFCGNLAAVKVLNVIGAEGSTEAQLLGAFLISLAVGGVAYGRERIAEAKRSWDGTDRRQQQLSPHQYEAAKDANELNTDG
jgi:uncharacterized membrane protein YidH (DUF202 family)